MKTVAEVMRETGMKRNQIMLLIHAKDSRWFQVVPGGMWHVEESDLMQQIERRKLKK